MDDTALLKELNNELKSLKTWEDLIGFTKKISGRFGLYGKRRGYQAFDFTHMYNDKNKKGDYMWYAQSDNSLNKVHYLYDDGKSSGKSYICNLYRVLEVR